MKQFIQIILFLFFSTVCQENLAFPRKDGGQSLVEMTRQPFRIHLPRKQTINIRNRRAEGEEAGGGGVGEFLSNAVQAMGDRLMSLIRPFSVDGIAASSAFKSPTVFVGGFSMMMQPMPNGTELAGQIMQMAPHYTNFLPTLPGAGRQEEGDISEKEI